MRGEDIFCRKCFIYIVCENGIEEGPVKVGISQSPSIRLMGLQSGCWNKLTVYHTFLLDNKGEAAKIEAAFHAAFNELRMCGEWFGITPQRAIAAINTYLNTGVFDAED